MFTPTQTSSICAPRTSAIVSVDSNCNEKQSPRTHPQNKVRAERFSPAADVVEDVVRIVTAAGIDVGGIEYVESARDGKRYYYDINALSNFVADPLRVLGFDPVTRLIDYLEGINYAYSAA